MAELRGNPMAAIVILMLFLFVAGMIFVMGQGCVDRFGNTDPRGRTPAPDCAEPTNLAALVLLACGVVIAALAGLILPPFPRRSWMTPESPVPAPAPASPPAVLVACPGCGRTVDAEVGRCPCCQTPVEGGGDG